MVRKVTLNFKKSKGKKKVFFSFWEMKYLKKGEEKWIVRGGGCSEENPENWNFLFKVLNKRPHSKKFNF